METITNAYSDIPTFHSQQKGTAQLASKVRVFYSDYLRSQRRRTVPSWYMAVPLKVVKLKAFLMADEARPIRRLSGESGDGDGAAASWWNFGGNEC
jgi:hypothetical protein